MLRRSVTAIAVTSVLLLAACIVDESGAPQEEATSEALLQEGEWKIENIGGQGVVDGSDATLLFGSDGQLSGNASCNRLFASYTVQGDKLTISSPGGLTMMACPPTLMDQERTLVDLLGTVATYRIDESGALILGSRSGKQILARR